MKQVIAQEEQTPYLVFTEVDKASARQQNEIYELVKDRQIRNTRLPENTVIILTIEEEMSVKRLSPDLYHLCTIAF